MVINQQFKEAITLSSPRIAFRITDLETDEVITSVDDGLLIEAPYDFISDSFVGEFPIWKLKITFSYLTDKKSYVGKRFLGEVGAYSHDGEDWGSINWISIGKFKVAEDGQETDDIQKQISLTMYDFGELLDVRYEPLSFPLTGLQIRTQIASRAGLEFAVGQEALPYDEYTFNGINVGTGQAITDREVLKQYAQLNMASGYLDRNGGIRIKSVFTSIPVDTTISNFDYSELDLEPEYGPINSLIYANKPEDDDESYQDIEAKDEDSINDNGKKSLEFSNNIFLDPLTLEEQQTEINKLFNIVNGFSYTPFELDYFARPDLDPYDIVKIADMENNESYAPITSMDFNYNGGLIGSLKTKKLPETLTKSDIPDIFERVSNAEIRVDRANNMITSNVQRTEDLEDELSEQASLITQTENKIETEITERVQQGEELESLVGSKITQTVEDWTALFTRLEQDQDLTNDEIELIQTYFRISADGIILGKSDSPIEFFAENDIVGFRENGEVIAYWQEGTMHVENLIAIMTIVIGHHQIEKYDSPVAGKTSVVRMADE